MDCPLHTDWYNAIQMDAMEDKGHGEEKDDTNSTGREAHTRR